MTVAEAAARYGRPLGERRAHRCPRGGGLYDRVRRYVLDLESEGGETTTDVGKYVVVHETREDGSTKILLDCFNSNSPPPA